MATTEEVIIEALASNEDGYDEDREGILEHYREPFAKIAAAIEAAGFVPGASAAHIVSDRKAMVEAICSVDPDYEDYPDYVKDGYRKQMEAMATVVLTAGLGIPFDV